MTLVQDTLQTSHNGMRQETISLEPLQHNNRIVICNKDKPPSDRNLVGGGSGVLGGGETNLAVGGIEHGVEALKESVTVDEVKTRSAVGPDVSNDEVDVATGTTDRAVERTGPDLGVSGESVCGAADVEVEVGQGAVLA